MAAALLLGSGGYTIDEFGWDIRCR